MPHDENDRNNFHYGIIILAAGTSSRLGTPKQLLIYKGKTLLQHILEIATDVNAGTVVAVLGANGDLILKEIVLSKKYHMVINDSWSEGIASSIRCGLNTLLQLNPTCNGAIFAVCDQPYITATLLNDLIKTQQETGKYIAACSYADTLGTPVLFHKKLFPELLKLEGDNGAKKIIKKYPGSVVSFLFPEGKVDIDTSADYEKLSK